MKIVSIGGQILYNDESDSRKKTLENAVADGADLREAKLQGADLREANLREAKLQGADLREAWLHGAWLHGAWLLGADLREAWLHGAWLHGAWLQGADLREAKLQGADLREANLVGATIDTGELWEDYLTSVVPSLLAAGGKKVTASAWTCHKWTNCPMAQAFGVSDLTDIPVKYRPKVEQFIRFFDAGLIKGPK